MGITAPGLSARRAALTALDAVLDRDRPLDAAWQEARLDRLPDRDAGFARTLVLTTLRRLGTIDAVIDQFVKRRPVGKSRLGVQILRLAATELLALDSPPHAAVDCAVRLANSRNETRRLSGMVNAVSRKMSTEGLKLFDALDADRIDTPAWLWERLKRAYGAGVAAEIAAAHRNGAQLDLTARNGDAPGWAERLGGTVTPTGSIRLDSRGSVTNIEGYEDGAWWVQDAAAALPVRLLGDVKVKRVLDLCAAPGGKTMQLAAAGADVTALDLSEPRARRLRENLLRTRLNVDVVVADALEWTPDFPFEAVILDAPCSASGTIRRHPDLPHLKTGLELNALTPLQDILLRKARDWLAPGGTLVFATCSLFPEEGEERIAAFLGSNPDMRLDPLDAEADALPGAMIRDGMLRTLPSHWAETGGLDGFFAARMRREDAPA